MSDINDDKSLKLQLESIDSVSSLEDADIIPLISNQNGAFVNVKANFKLFKKYVSLNTSSIVDWTNVLNKPIYYPSSSYSEFSKSSSFSQTSSYSENSQFSLSASYVPAQNTDKFVVTASGANNNLTASYALTALYALNGGQGSSGSINTSSLVVTASNSLDNLTSSYSNNSLSASFSNTSNISMSSSFSTTSSFTVSSSFSNTAFSSSYSITASYIDCGTF